VALGYLEDRFSHRCGRQATDAACEATYNLQDAAARWRTKLRKDSATDAVGQTTDAASEATDNRQNAAGEGTDQAADTLLSVARPTGRASRVTVRGGSAVLALVSFAAWPGDESTVDRPGSPVDLGRLEDGKDSATDAVGQTTDVASEATDDLQDAAGEVADQAADTAGQCALLFRIALEPILGSSLVFLPRALPRMTLRRSSTRQRSYRHRPKGSPENDSPEKPHLTALMSSRPVGSSKSPRASPARDTSGLGARVRPPGQIRAGAVPGQQFETPAEDSPEGDASRAAVRGFCRGPSRS